MKRNLLLGVMAAAALVAGCGRCQKAPEAAMAGSAAPKSEEPLATGPLVTYSRSGGFAGMQQTLTVNTDGSMTLKNRNLPDRTGTADAARLGRLRELLASEELKKAPLSAKASGADLTTYTITLPDGRGFLTMDAVSNPPVVDEILAVLNELVGECR